MDTPSQACRDCCWTSALRLGSFSYYELAAASHFAAKTVAVVVREWAREGVVRPSSTDTKYRRRFELVDPAVRRPASVIGAEVANRQSPAGNMWTAMRRLKVFSARDIAAHATTDTLEVDLDAAREYCRALLGADFLQIYQAAKSPEREPVYRLLRNTGPHAPVERRLRAVWDPNKAEMAVIGPKDGARTLIWRDA